MTEQAPHRMDGEGSQRRFLRMAIDALVLFEVALNWLATQLAAAVMHYPPVLMGRMFGRLYQPFAWWWWRFRWPQGAIRIGSHVNLLEPLWRICDGIILIPPVVLGGIVALAAWMLIKPQREDLHGAASWANLEEIKRSELG